MSLTDLEQFFNSIDLPKEIRLSKWEYITNVPVFIESHLGYLKNNSGNIHFLPYYERLIELKEILIKNKQNDTIQHNRAD